MNAGPRMTTDILARKFTVEATRPSASEVAQLREILEPGTSVYVTAVPTGAAEEIVTAAAALRNAGLEPVVHVAARRLKECRGAARYAEPPHRRSRRAAVFWSLAATPMPWDRMSMRWP